MKCQFTVVVVALIVVITGGLAFAMADKDAIKEPIQPNTDIRLNSLGYLPRGAEKSHDYHQMLEFYRKRCLEK